MLRFTPQPVTIDAAANDLPSKSITGLAVPYSVPAIDSNGTAVMFMPGSMPTDGPAPKLFQYHRSDMPIGLVTERVETPEGMLFTAKISDIESGREALTLMADGVLDAVSIGATPTEFSYDQDGTMIVTAAKWHELSIVPIGAFESARIHQIAAGMSNNEKTEPDTDNPNEIAPNSESENSDMENETPATIEAATSVNPIWATASRGFTLPTAAEYISAAAVGGSKWQEINAKIKAAAPDITTADTPGILPENIVGSPYDGLNAIRPFVSAIGVRAMPSAGATFRRPKITVRPVVTQQPTGQLNQLDPSTVTVANNDISKLTFGTFTTLSEQDLDWSDPASISIVLDQLAIAYGQATDNYAVDTCYAGATQTETITDLDDPAEWLAAIYGAAVQISSASNYLPTHMVVDPIFWYRLGKLTSSTGSPAFPFVGAPNLVGQNALGTLAANSWNGAPLGLTLVVDKNMPADSALVGHLAGPAAGFEFYEQQKGAISVDVPSTLGRTIAWRGYAAGFVADSTKLVKLLKPAS